MIELNTKQSQQLVAMHMIASLVLVVVASVLGGV